MQQYNYNDKSISVRQHLHNCVAGSDDFCREWIDTKSDNECDIWWSDLTSSIKARKERSNKAIQPAFDEWLKINHPVEYQRRQDIWDGLWNGKRQEPVDYDKLSEQDLLYYWRKSLNKIERHMFNSPEWPSWSAKAEASLVKWLQMHVSQWRIDELDISVFERSTECKEPKLLMTVDAQGIVLDKPIGYDELFAEWKAENQKK